jgi:uncharacterized protein RhaS with RHS repeats
MSLAYTSTGKLASVTDARGGAVSYAYDTSDRLIQYTDADGGLR